MIRLLQIGLKALGDYGSDADTDDLAGDSDLDTSTCKSLLLSSLISARDWVTYDSNVG